MPCLKNLPKTKLSTEELPYRCIGCGKKTNKKEFHNLRCKKKFIEKVVSQR